MSETAIPTRPSSGISRFIHDLRYRRDRHRQFVGISFIALVTFVARPLESLFLPGAVVVVVGMLIRLWASGHVKKDKQLATTGPYAFVRHPLYVGNHLIAVGFCLASSLWWSVPLWLLITALYYPPAIRGEDTKLERLFGDDWREWRAKTHAQLPSLRPYGGFKLGSWSFRQSLVQNGEPIYIVVFCLALYYIHRLLG
ncbi:MAG: isoprenylcysteine carboxylmethyltransferase family protein [Acidobacteriota bacterium]|nr:isoprenylcysteine carboxylmethyltransferase family protein [Acidobacteriota bacterium]MDH3785928.1 isoprenylcysteine carboxylmethyltransferase family protein [Acidobacteriota bacterium]